MILSGFHVNADIWVFFPSYQPSATGLQMLTPRAKRWAMAYKQTPDPDVLNDFVWVPRGQVGDIMRDLERTNLNVLLDFMEDVADA